jgi:hypothetical protein
MKKSQLSRIAKSSIVLCALLLSGGSTRIYADTPGVHPFYLHAIDYLRQARALLETHFNEPKHIQTVAEAVPKVDSAISDLKNASKLDDKHLSGVPPPDGSLDEKGRLHKAAELLRMAHQEAAKPESDPLAKPLQARGLRDIDEASAILQKVL